MGELSVRGELIQSLVIRYIKVRVDLSELLRFLESHLNFELQLDINDTNEKHTTLIIKFIDESSTRREVTVTIINELKYGSIKEK